jgi:hypothetical protein
VVADEGRPQAVSLVPSRGGFAMDYTTCPEEGCAVPAEVVDRRVLDSTDGPVEHIDLVCILGHRFFMPVDQLPMAA